MDDADKTPVIIRNCSVCGDKTVNGADKCPKHTPKLEVKK